MEIRKAKQIYSYRKIAMEIIAGWQSDSVLKLCLVLKNFVFGYCSTFVFI